MRNLEKARKKALKYYYAHKDERLAYYRKNREREIIAKRNSKNIYAPILAFGVYEINDLTPPEK